ncbi:MAG: hypothetical protein ABIT47_00825 [Candidatus Paceibacterota bacterium]
MNVDIEQIRTLLRVNGLDEQSSDTQISSILQQAGYAPDQQEAALRLLKQGQAPSLLSSAEARPNPPHSISIPALQKQDRVVSWLRVYYILLVVYLIAFTIVTLGFGPLLIQGYFLESLIVITFLFVISLCLPTVRRHKKQTFFFLLTFIFAASPLFLILKPAIGLSNIPLFIKVSGMESKASKGDLLMWQKRYKEDEATGYFETHPGSKFDETLRIKESRDKYCADSFSKGDSDYKSLCQ